MIFVRTVLGALVVATVVALAGLGYRLWTVQRDLSDRVSVLEERVAALPEAVEEE